MTLWSRIERRLSDLAGELVLDDYREQLASARQLLARGEAAMAAAELEAMLSQKDDHGQAWILLGEARLALRAPAEALLAFQRALGLRSDDPAALVGLGTAQVALGQYREAIAPLARAIADAGGDRGLLAEAYRSLGTAWRRLGDLDKAIRELRKAVAEDAGDPEARAALAEALVTDGGPVDEARRHLERATRAQPAPISAELAQGRMALLDGDAAAARRHFTAARATAERDPTPLGRAVLLDAMVGVGDAALLGRDPLAAHTTYLEALQLEPGRAALHRNLAAAHRAIGNHEAALAAFEHALTLGAEAAVLREALDLAILVGDGPRQTRWAEQMLARDPDDRRALVARGLGLAAAGDLAAARDALAAAAARDDLDARFGLARLALDDDPARAVSQALAALRLAPHHALGRRVLTEARARQHPPLGPSPELEDLARSLERAVALRPELGHLVADLARATGELDQPLLVTVMGEFSSGKSSFVNAFIGAEVAPTGITPTTATINVVRYGRERGGRIIGRDGAVRELAWAALFPELRALSAEAARAIDRVEILLPLPQLEKINIVDTPGLNSIQPEHEATARAFIARADAVVWVFTANQGGKASERKALGKIREEGRRVLGVLNKADQLSADDLAEVTAFIAQSLGELVEVVVPFSARRALARKLDEASEGAAPTRASAVGKVFDGAGATSATGAGGADPAGGALTSATGGAAGATHAATAIDGNWRALAHALEERFFAQARQLKRAAYERRLRAIIAEADRALEGARRRAAEAAAVASRGRDALEQATRRFLRTELLAQRRALAEAVTALYRRAAREVLELVQPRRLPFSAHTATAADRDYVIALLEAGYDVALDGARLRFRRELGAPISAVQEAAAALTEAADADVRADLARAAADAMELATTQVFDRARAYLRGFLEGGHVEAFFRNDVPRLELAEDAVYHALVRGAPDLDRDLGAPMERAAADVLGALAKRLDYWSGVVEISELDDQLGLGRVLGDVAAHLTSP